MDPERYSSAGTAWWFQATDTATIDVELNRDHARAIDVAAYGANSFSVVSVENRNVAYARTPEGSASWTTGETQESLVSKISSGGKRLLDLAPYTVAGQTRFAATWVDNTGAAAKTWYWWLGLTPADITGKLNACECRLIDLDPIGGGRYDVVMIRNTGVDTLTSWWYVGLSQTQVRQYLSNNAARVVDLAPDGSGQFAVIMVRDGIPGGITFDQPWATLVGGPPAGMRYVHIQQYKNTAGSTVWLSVSVKSG